LALAAYAVTAVSACGYAPVYGGGRRATESFYVHLAQSSVPDAVTADEVVAGVRDELARHGALAERDAAIVFSRESFGHPPGSARSSPEQSPDYPRVEVEVLRVDEGAMAIAVGRAPDGSALPASGASRVGVVVRAYVRMHRDAEPVRDTGDMRVHDTIAVSNQATTALFGHIEALRALGRRAGRRIGRTVLGVPALRDDE